MSRIKYTPPNINLITEYCSLDQTIILGGNTYIFPKSNNYVLSGYAVFLVSFSAYNLTDGSFDGLSISNSAGQFSEPITLGSGAGFTPSYYNAFGGTPPYLNYNQLNIPFFIEWGAWTGASGTLNANIIYYIDFLSKYQ